MLMWTVDGILWRTKIHTYSHTHTPNTWMIAARNVENNKTCDHFICSSDEKNLLLHFFPHHYFICWFHFRTLNVFFSAMPNRRKNRMQWRWMWIWNENEWCWNCGNIHWELCVRTIGLIKNWNDNKPKRTEIRNDWLWFKIPLILLFTFSSSSCSISLSISPWNPRSNHAPCPITITSSVAFLFLLQYANDFNEFQCVWLELN